MSSTPINQTPVRVCHVFCGAKGGVWMVEQLRELRNRYGYYVCAVIPEAQGPVADQLRNELIPFHVAEFVYSFHDTAKLTRAILLLARLFGTERFDIVQTHVFWTAVVVRPAAWIADVPVRLAMVAGPFHLEAKTSRWIERATQWMETALIPSCRKSVDLYRAMGISQDRLALIYYGADSAKFDPAQIPPARIRAEYGWPENTPLIALVAWFYHRLPPSPWVPPELHNRGVKGQEDFVRAAALVLREFPSAKFLLVGGGFDKGGEDYMEQVRALVQLMGLEASVIFTGLRGDINQVLRDVDVAVQASLNENLGGTIEALLMECPTVATRVGGMVDTVLDGETGVLVHPSNPTDLARGILELLRDPQRARSLGRAGRKLMTEKISLDQTVAQLHQLYLRFLTRSGQRKSGYRAWVSALRGKLLLPIGASFKAMDRIAAWRFEGRKEPPVYQNMEDLRAHNPPYDIVEYESVARLWSGCELPVNGIYLGHGWYDIERDSEGSFRWLTTNGEIVITRPDGTARSFVLDVEPGPGQPGQPFELRVVNAQDVTIYRIALAARQQTTIRIQPSAAEAAVFRLMVANGEPTPDDPRTLNVRVRRIEWERPLFLDLERLRALNQAEDIVEAGVLARCQYGGDLPQNGLLLGRGWYGAERDESGPYRWLQSDAELVLTRPEAVPQCIAIDAESGPGQHCQPFDLELVDADGVSVGRATVSSRQVIYFHLPPQKRDGVVLRLRAPSGVPIATDSRILHACIRRIVWDQPAAQSTAWRSDSTT